MTKKLFISLALVCLVLYPILSHSQNQVPLINGLSAWVDVSNNQLHVYYSVADNEGENLEIFLGITANDTVYNIDVSTATGDIGFPVVPGTGKEIIWDYGLSHPNIFTYSSLFIFASYSVKINRKSSERQFKALLR